MESHCASSIMNVTNGLLLLFITGLFFVSLSQKRLILMKISLIMMLLIVPVFLNGCASVSGYPDRSYDLKAELAALDMYHRPDIVNTYNGKEGEAKKDYRNEVVNARLRAIDLHFSIFEQELARENIVGNVGVDWAVLALGGATALAPLSATKSILGAVSGGITGAKGSVDKNIFYNKTMPVLLAKMEALRKEVLVKIREGLTKNTSDYPLTQALIDLDDYYKAGTIPAAVIGIAVTSGESIKKSGDEIKNILKGKYSVSKEGELLRKFWKPDGDNINPVNQEKLKDWLKSKGIIASITFFIDSSELFWSAQKVAVKDLNITE